MRQINGETLLAGIPLKKCVLPLTGGRIPIKTQKYFWLGIPGATRTNVLVKGQNFIQAQRVRNVAYLQQWAVHVHGTNLCQYTSFIFFSMALQVDPDKVFHLLCQATMISPLLMHRLTSHFEHSMNIYPPAQAFQWFRCAFRIG